MSKRAVILAGGKGTRLKPYTIALPKPLVPVGDTPILEIIIKQLAKKGFDHITISINHLSDIIKAFCGDGKKWGIKIDYSLEEKPLGTMGPLKLIKDLPNDFLVLNGDVLSNLDFGEFYNWHVKNSNDFTISIYNKGIKNKYGVITTNKDNKLIEFSEKPTHNFKVSMGVYMLNRSVLDIIPKGLHYGFDDLMYAMIEKEAFPSTKIFDGFWLDIGTPEDYEKAFDMVKEFDI